MEVFVPYYPVNEFGPMMKGLIIGGLGIFHVFLAQFAIGGGMLLCYMQLTAMRSGKGVSPDLAKSARLMLDSYFKVLVLLSFVLGALTGVAMWFTAIQISARTIGIMVDEFHWLWATEYTFFFLEVVAGYAFYRYSTRLDDRTRLLLLVTYSVAAWFSLFWINGIISWQLTPGGWTHEAAASWTNVWAGFFNPSFWPSLFYRSFASLSIATLAGCVVINTMSELSREQKHKLIRHVAFLMLPMGIMPLLGLWYYFSMPGDSQAWITGGSVAMTMFLNLAVGTSLLVGLYALVGILWRKLNMNGATATLLLVLAFVATAGGEFVREGVRKPYAIRETLYSNSIRPHEVQHLRSVGSVTNDPYPLLDQAQYPNDQIVMGMKVYRFQCAVCHTLDGVNGLSHLTGSWDTSMKRENISKLQLLKDFMPPFAGTAEELEALVQTLEWLNSGRPTDWPATQEQHVLDQINDWLNSVSIQRDDRKLTLDQPTSP